MKTAAMNLTNFVITLKPKSVDKIAFEIVYNDCDMNERFSEYIKQQSFFSKSDNDGDSHGAFHQGITYILYSLLEFINWQKAMETENQGNLIIERKESD